MSDLLWRQFIPHDFTKSCVHLQLDFMCFFYGLCSVQIQSSHARWLLKSDLTRLTETSSSKWCSQSTHQHSEEMIKSYCVYNLLQKKKVTFKEKWVWRIEETLLKGPSECCSVLTWGKCHSNVNCLQSIKKRRGRLSCFCLWGCLWLIL